MKRILTLAVLLALTVARAQDAAVEERLNKLSGYIEELQAAKVSMDKRMTSLVKEVEAVRDANKANGTVATQDDIKRLTDFIKEVDRKRLEDYEKIHQELEKLAKALCAPVPPKSGSSKKAKEKDMPPKDVGAKGAADGGQEKGFWHTIAAGDAVSTIAQAYREQLKIKVTTEDILKANPGLKPNSLVVGKKIWIPAPEK
jgi:LysM repeat protein